MGQPVANPLFGELRLHRGTLKGLLSALRLGEDGDSNRGFHSHRGYATVSEAPRKAARARWGTGGTS